MDRLISYLLALCVAAGIMFAWDRHPPLGWHTKPLPLVGWTFGFDLPDSLATQRDKAQAALRLAQDAQKACLGQLGRQNASIASLSAESAAKLAAVNHDLASTRAVVESLRRNAVDLRDYQPKGADQCSRWEDADREVKGALK